MEGKKKVKKRKQNLHAWKTYAKCEWCLKLLPYMTLHVKRVDLSVDEGITKKYIKWVEWVEIQDIRMICLLLFRNEKETSDLKVS
jgi:hypothetical protein